MRIKTFILAFLLGGSLALAGVASAQHAPMLSRKQMTEKRLAHMKKALKLTDQQSDQLKAIWQQNADKLKADRAAIQTAAKGSPARKAAVSQLKTDAKGMHQQLKAVLTPEQQQKFKKMRLQMVERRERGLKKRERRLKKIEHKLKK